MTDRNEPDAPQWDRGWEEHKRRQLVRLARLPFAQKLEWLEEAQRLGEFLVSQATRKNRDAHGGPDVGGSPPAK